MRRPVGVKRVLLGFCCSLVISASESPLSPPFHPHSGERCSLGASWAFSFQPVLPPVYRPLFPSQDGSWARRLTQSPKLGALAFHFERAFLVMRPPRPADCCSATARTLLHLPTNDAVRLLIFVR